tara:strand:- start:959 stop:1333 length:375 start_codon:yes stop_codon:yes gene_type:complete
MAQVTGDILLVALDQREAQAGQPSRAAEAAEAQVVAPVVHPKVAATVAQEMRVLVWQAPQEAFPAVGAVLPKMMVAGATVPLAAFACGRGNGDIHCGIDDPKIRRRYVNSPRNTARRLPQRNGV